MTSVETESANRKQRKRTLNRAEFLQQIARRLPAEAFLPDEACDILVGTLTEARKAAAAAELRILSDRYGVYSMPDRVQVKKREAAPPPRLASCLSRLNSSRVCPALLRPAITWETTNLAQIRMLAAQAYRAGESWPKLLDAIATGAVISWAAAATFLSKIIRRELEEAAVICVRQARTFWNAYAAGRARVTALQLGGKIPV